MLWPRALVGAALALAAAGCQGAVGEPPAPAAGADGGAAAETNRGLVLPNTSTAAGSAEAAAGAAPEPDARPADAVLYTLGLSTDPYGDSRPAGVGVATGIAGGPVETTEVERRGLGWHPGAAWLADARVVVPRKPPRVVPPYRAPLVFSVAGSELEPAGTMPLRPLEWHGWWSPDGSLLATEPAEVVDCGDVGGRAGLTCTRAAGTVYVARADGSDRREVTRGHLGGWTPDGRLLVTDDRYLEYQAVDPRTGESAHIIRRGDVARLAGVRRAGVGKPVWSADGQYIAAYAGVAWPKRSRITNAIVVATADGRPLRFLTSPYLISMLAWSPSGHRLAWTTSGFPDPHELFVLDEPRGTPRRLFATRARHFDWVTWSPDGRRLLVDDEHFGYEPRHPGRHAPGRWLLLAAATGERVRSLPRLGGAPQWCCPTAPWGRNE